MSEEKGAVKAYYIEKKRNEKIFELITEFEDRLTKAIEENYKRRDGYSEEYQVGIKVGLETAKSMYLVQVWQEIQRLYE
ncbi:hypothetical protein NSQ59_27500 [Margalitia sp. FSL K6-0131]|uniref:hypothetical protein n=1 Tax=Margalitia sp. FSL K6-0131 TaxID=2954604 RepID=UPI0030F8B246